MREQIINLSVDWDGRQLLATPSFGKGWVGLGLLPQRVPRQLTTPCYSVRDLNQFQLGMYLCEASRPFTDAWHEAEAALFELGHQVAPSFQVGSAPRP